MRPDRRPAQRGFTLLEAVVALTILASAGLALYASLNSSLLMVDRAVRSQQTDTAVENALAWMETVNVMQTPTAEQVIGDYRLRWRAELIEPVIDGDTGFLQSSLYQLGLYRVELELWRDDRLERALEIRRVGYRQVRQPAVL